MDTGHFRKTIYSDYANKYKYLYSLYIIVVVTSIATSVNYQYDKSIQYTSVFFVITCSSFIYTDIHGVRHG